MRRARDARKAAWGFGAAVAGGVARAVLDDGPDQPEPMPPYRSEQLVEGAGREDDRVGRVHDFSQFPAGVVRYGRTAW